MPDNRNQPIQAVDPEKVRVAMAGEPVVRLVVLFGSRASGLAGSDSDVDLADLETFHQWAVEKLP